MKTAQPRKQHKMLYKAPLSIRHKHFSASLSDSLKASHHIDSVPARRGDTVRIMRGDRKGAEGKITEIDRQKFRIFIEGVNREKVDGSTIPAPVHPSKVMITSLNLDDKWRRESLKVEAARKAEKRSEEEKKAPKPKKARRKRKPAEVTLEKAQPSRRRRAKAPSKEKKGEPEDG